MMCFMLSGSRNVYNRKYDNNEDLANYISVSRIIMSIILVFTDAFSVAFYT